MGSDHKLKLWFYLFRCPRCGHYERHARLIGSLGQYLNWCPACSSCFAVRRGSLVGIGLSLLLFWGASLGLIMLSVEVVFPNWRVGWAMLAANVVIVPAFGALWRIIYLRIAKYDYVGKCAP